MQSMSKNLTFSYDENGKVSCKGDAATKKEEYMKEILENNSITVLLEVQKVSEKKRKDINYEISNSDLPFVIFYYNCFRNELWMHEML